MKPFSLIAIAVFSLVAMLQLARVVLGWAVSIGGVSIPTWVSIVAFIVAGTLAVMLHREMRT